MTEWRAQLQPLQDASSISMFKKVFLARDCLVLLSSVSDLHITAHFRSTAYAAASLRANRIPPARVKAPLENQSIMETDARCMTTHRPLSNPNSLLQLDLYQIIFCYCLIRIKSQYSATVWHGREFNKSVGTRFYSSCCDERSFCCIERSSPLATPS
jgi:hypothetical protein